MAQVEDNQARIIFYDDLWRVLRPDGLHFFKEVWFGRTEVGAIEFCKKRGWQPLHSGVSCRARSVKG